MEKDISDSPKFLKHYTSLENLLSILLTKELRLADPNKWDDKNDIASVSAYARHYSVSVKVLCLTHDKETVHHWNTYAKQSPGCRIDFDTEIFLDRVKNITGLIYGEMKYLSRPFDLSPYTVDDYPFLKRLPYECENEYRIVWKGNGEAPPIPIEGLISRVTLSPYLGSRFAGDICDLLREKYGIKEVCNSAILEYNQWTAKFEGNTG